MNTKLLNKKLDLKNKPKPVTQPSGAKVLNEGELKKVSGGGTIRNSR